MSVSIKDGFSQPSVHSLRYKDGFCDTAHLIREELLKYTTWQTMRQSSYFSSNDGFIPARQNGITTGHLDDRSRDILPHCIQFRDFLHQHSQALCELIDVDCVDHRIEINAMAYGQGCWLSSHNDYIKHDTGNVRVAAWMLYLTHPDDGEWPVEKGGGVRLFHSDGEAVRLQPKFNRFALFKVSSASTHEIEKITWDTGWEHSRLALSGWIRGRTSREARDTCVFIASPRFAQARAAMETFFQGSLACYRLQAQQQAYAGIDTSRAVAREQELMADYEAHLAAPDGTCFSHRVPGPKGVIIVLNEQDEKTLYFGSLEAYRRSPSAGQATVSRPD
jgi:Rps23 Pro-64 3,4-dihydroxylase Tpa1-like proline 4-hydroxylase